MEGLAPGKTHMNNKQAFGASPTETPTELKTSKSHCSEVKKNTQAKKKRKALL